MDQTSVYILIQKSFGGNDVRIHVNSKGKILSTRKVLLRGGSNPRHCIKQDSESHYQLSYSDPALVHKDLNYVQLISNETFYRCFVFVVVFVVGLGFCFVLGFFWSEIT